MMEASGCDLVLIGSVELVVILIFLIAVENGMGCSFDWCYAHLNNVLGCFE